MAHPKDKPPKCAKCGSPRNPHPYMLGPGRYEWLCGPCEFQRTHPETPPAPLAPWERKPLPLQAERLF